MNAVERACLMLIGFQAVLYGLLYTITEKTPFQFLTGVAVLSFLVCMMIGIHRADRRSADAQRD